MTERASKLYSDQVAPPYDCRNMVVTNTQTERTVAILLQWYVITKRNVRIRCGKKTTNKHTIQLWCSSMR
jgi:hypothetical protein